MKWFNKSVVTLNAMQHVLEKIKSQVNTLFE